ncbi:molybdopterin cofactor-binding domain-containing protein [Caulobacter sp. KR2-114]|uniref:xanthine dehydrogenase family protein molybdopterin-binding subunit n=1 Tax=Caulobacter sp. KR2-114 TaxID=3400912 RepID=UPI003BFED426
MIPVNLANNPRLDRWIGFETPGRVRVAVGKVEYGQGALTGLAMIAAEELDVGMSRLDVVTPQTDLSPDEGLTVGSMSIETSGAAIRAACAEARALFVAEAAKRLGCAPGVLDVRDGVFQRDGADAGLSYWDLADAVDLSQPPTGEARWKSPDQHRLLGQSAPRLDLPPKVFGAAYLQDLALPGMLHARVLRQPGPDAVLADLDEAAIRHAAGEAAIEIVREGQFVALLSPSERAVQAAIGAAELGAAWHGARDLSPAVSEPISLKAMPATAYPTGDPPAEASNRRRHQAAYGRPYIAHGSMGPSCGVAQFQDGRLTVWTHAQGVYPMRQLLARLCGLAPEAISVIHAQGAGTYGHNGSDDAAVDAAVIAMRRPGAPIRVQWRREDEFGHEPLGTAMHIELAAELDAGGRLVDYTADIWSGSHTGGRGQALAQTALGLPPPPPMVPPTGPGGVRFSGGILNALPSYDIPARRYAEHLVSPGPVRTSSLRGLGGPVNTYAGECFIDELAEIAGQDPLAFRLGMTSDPRARHVLETLARMSGWAERGPGGAGQGLGLAYCRYRDRGAYVAVAAALSVDAEVRLERLWCAADCGQVINPDGVKNQLEGGMIMAASWALKEQVRLAGRGVQSITWDDYPILRFDEVPPVEIELVMAQHERCVGAGEVSLGPAMAAIGNAVSHALGARIRELPFTREKIAHALLAD